MERRQRNRAKVILGGTIEHGSSGLTVDCVVRDLSDTGAKIRIPPGTLMPNNVDLVIDCKQRRQSASVVWRGARDIGLTFATVASAQIATAADGSSGWGQRLDSARADRAMMAGQLSEIEAKERN